MRRITLTLILGLTCTGLPLLSGCGGGEPAPRRSPVAESGSDEPAAEEPAAEEPAAEEPTTEEPTVAAAETAEPAEAAKPSAAAAASEVAADKANFVGRIVIKGSVPELPPVLKKGTQIKDALCAEHDIADESLVSEGGGLGNVFIFMRKAPKGVDIPGPPEEPLVLDNKICAFVPHAAIVQTGQLMLLTNSDPFPHNTHTNPFKSDPINPLIPGNTTEGLEHKYERAETVPVKTNCDIHPWMLSWHLPVDHPWATISNPDGTFEIKDIPPGEHEFRIWHERVGNIEKGVDITFEPGKVVEMEFTVDAAELTE
ncbi:MAG: hypothetical protein ACF8PG_13850 [Maioricimonas sp. JB045]